ncbi:MAG: hypothetical protein LBG52_08075 [Candidatus Peribacteria bacterium]|nr:hypothetical protein [Candidatus Peribacteria bacterium]
MKNLIFLLLFCLGLTGCCWNCEEPEQYCPESPPPCDCTQDADAGDSDGETSHLPCGGKYFKAPKVTLGVDPDCYMADGVKVRVVDEDGYFIDGKELYFHQGNRGIHVFTHSGIRNHGIYFQYGDRFPIWVASVSQSGKNYFALEKKNHYAETLRIFVGSEGYWQTTVWLMYY